jgi:hypothetical protein
MVIYYLSIFNTNKISVASFHLQIRVPQNSICPAAWVRKETKNVKQRYIDVDQTAYSFSEKYFEQRWNARGYMQFSKYSLEGREMRRLRNSRKWVSKKMELRASI